MKDKAKQGLTDQDKIDFIITHLTQKAQFEYWLKVLFYLNYSLSIKFDSIYQTSFYVKLFEIITKGIKYCETSLPSIKASKNKELEEWYTKVLFGLKELRNEVSEEEFKFIEYKRHNACHIFQDAYEIQFNEKELVKRNNRFELVYQFHELVKKHGTEENFDKYIFNKLHPIINSIFKSIETKHSSK